MRLGAGRRSFSSTSDRRLHLQLSSASGRRLHLLRPAQKMTSGDQECMEVEPAPAQPFNRGGASSSAAANEDDDEDLQFLWGALVFALSVTSLTPENCLESPWRPEARPSRCPNCYCYVCDAPVSQCPQWATAHCMATHSKENWRRARSEWKANGGAAPSCRGGLRVVCSTHLLLLFLIVSVQHGRLLLFLVVLLVLVLDPSVKVPAAEQVRWSAERILKGCEQVFPLESNPPGLAPGLSLRPYQRQSLAFMMQIEQSTDHSLRGHNGKCHLRGGFLADEMGMGKTAVVTALVLASKHAGYSRGITVVLANNTLVGQWMDEIKKFAPSLKVAQFYGSTVRRVTRDLDIVVTSPNTNPPEELLPLAKRLIIDESHLYEPRSDPKLPSTKILGKQSRYRPDWMWCVTGTPFSQSLSQLETQAKMLGQWNYGVNLSNIVKYAELPSPHYDPPRPGVDDARCVSNQKIVDELRKLMIRHTKSQRIGGEAALSLPEADCQTVWVTMTPHERVLYDLHACVDGVPKWADVNRMTDLRLQDVRDGLGGRRGALAHMYLPGALDRAEGQMRSQAKAAFEQIGSRGKMMPRTLPDGIRTDYYFQPNPQRAKLSKYVALLADLKALVAAERSVSVVIFSHHNEVMKEVAGLLRDECYEVYEISRETEVGKRHKALRQFQAGQGVAPARQGAAS